MERKIEIPDFRGCEGGEDDAAMEDVEPGVPTTLSSSEAEEEWEKISEDWVSLFLDPAVLDEDDQSKALPLDLGGYSQFGSALPETNDHFSAQDLVADPLLLHSSDDDQSLSHSGNMALGSSLHVVEDLFGKEDLYSPNVELIHPKREHNGAASPASSLTQVSGGSSSGTEEVEDKEASNPDDLSMTLKREMMNGEVSSRSENPRTLSSAAVGKDSGFTNNPLQSSSCLLLQCEEGEIIGCRDDVARREGVSSSDSVVARVGSPAIVSQAETLAVRHLQSIGNAIKAGLLGRSGTEDRKSNCEAESFKLQSQQEAPEDQQSEHSDGDRKGEGDEDDEKRRARLMRNRESAQLSRQRKKVYVDELEGKLRTMAATVAELNTTISRLTAENVNLRRQLGYYYPAPGVAPRPGMPMHVMPMGPYPGMVAGRPMYAGGQMPPVPIPRIKAQTPARSSKRPKTGATKEGGDKKRTKLKAAGAASMAVMGLLCVAMLFGSIDRGLTGSSSVVGDYTLVGNVRVGGRVLTSWNDGVNPLNNTGGVSSWESGVGWRPLEPGEYGPEREGVPVVHTQLAGEKSQRITKAGFESSFGHSRDGNTTFATSTSPEYFSSVKAPLLMGSEAVPSNTSQLFAASVFVPGANGLVKVDGNLIIQAVMAGDKAANLKHSEKERNCSVLKKKKETKQSAEASSELPALKSASVKALDNLASREPKTLKNATTGPFVTVRPLSGNVSSIVEANSPVSPVLRAGSLQQWMLGGLHDPETNFIASELAKKIKSQPPVENLNAVAATEESFYSFTPYDAVSRGPLHSWLFSGLSTGPVLNTGMCTELFQFDTAANTSPGQASSAEAKNVAESMAAKAAQGSPHNVTSTLSVPVVPRSRRDPFAVPLPPVKPKPSADRPDERRNGTDPRVEKTVREHMHSQNLRHGVSSMVVSVMAGPEEYGDSRRKGATGMSRIFVVVLVDNQKYVTYSCMLPSGGPQAHVVAE